MATVVKAIRNRWRATSRSHARLLSHITKGVTGGIEGGALAQIEGRHRLLVVAMRCVPQCWVPTMGRLPTSAW